MILLTFLSKTHQALQGTGYRITPFNSSTGIYYEHTGIMRRSTSNWRVTIFLDTDRLNQTLQNITQKIQNLAYQCTDHHLGQCRQIIDEYGLVSKLNRADNLQKDLNREALELSRQNELRNMFKMPVSMRLRRTTPMLGFIGGIVGPVAGLLTYEDGEAIDNKLQELNEVQANISHLVGLQTHVVKAQLHDLYEQASKNVEKLNYYEHQLSEVAQNLHDVTRFYEGYNYTHALGRLLKAVEAALDDYIRAADNLKTVIQTARRGEMHPTMLSSQ